MYLAGIQYTSCIMGWPIQISRMHRLYYTLRGIRRLQGNTFTRPLRVPITLDLMVQLHIQFHRRFNYMDFTMLKAASLLAFFGMFRASEYLISHRTHFDPAVTLTVKDIKFSNNHSHITVRIKQSKTDPFRVGCNITIWANNGRMCPVTALRWYQLQHPHTGPLFTFRDGTYLSRQQFSSIIQQCIPDLNLNTHSFRIGGASSAYAAGIPETTIQTLGRWSSDAYRLYIRCPDTIIQHAQTLMSQTDTCDPWYPNIEGKEGTR